jgi:hypothetical protein
MTLPVVQSTGSLAANVGLDPTSSGSWSSAPYFISTAGLGVSAFVQAGQGAGQLPADLVLMIF